MRVMLIAAIDRCNAIGRGNALPWHLPDDLKRFKALTLGTPVLMGRKTAEAIGRALPGRKNLVLTRAGQAPFESMTAVGSIDAALQIACNDACGTLSVIGGGEVYALAMAHATHLALTHVDTVVDQADAFFPALDASAWTVTARETHPADAKHAFGFVFVDYARRT